MENFLQHPAFNAAQATPRVSDIDYGYLGGMNFHDQRRNFANATQQQDLANALILAQNQNLLTEWLKDDERRQAERAAGVAKANATASTVGRQSEAVTKGLEQGVEKTRRTLESDIEATNAGNKGKVDLERLNQWERDMDTAFQEIPDLNTPTSMIDVQQWAKKHKMPEAVQAQLMTASGPAELQQKLGTMRQQMAMKMSTTRQMMIEQQKAEADMAKDQAGRHTTGQYQLEGHRIDAASRERAAGIRADGSDKDETKSQFEARMENAATKAGLKEPSQWSEEEKQGVQVMARKALGDWSAQFQKEGGADILAGANMKGKTGDSYRATLISLWSGFKAQQLPAVARQLPDTPPGAQQTSGGQIKTGDRVTVVSPDGKKGTIPANQLQDALKQGYKQQ